MDTIIIILRTTKPHKKKKKLHAIKPLMWFCKKKKYYNVNRCYNEKFVIFRLNIYKWNVCYNEMYIIDIAVVL